VTTHDELLEHDGLQLPLGRALSRQENKIDGAAP